MTPQTRTSYMPLIGRAKLFDLPLRNEQELIEGTQGLSRVGCCAILSHVITGISRSIAFAAPNFQKPEERHRRIFNLMCDFAAVPRNFKRFLEGKEGFEGDIEDAAFKIMRLGISMLYNVGPKISRDGNTLSMTTDGSIFNPANQQYCPELNILVPNVTCYDLFQRHQSMMVAIDQIDNSGSKGKHAESRFKISSLLPADQVVSYVMIAAAEHIEYLKEEQAVLNSEAGKQIINDDALHILFLNTGYWDELSGKLDRYFAHVEHDASASDPALSPLEKIIFGALLDVRGIIVDTYTETPKGQFNIGDSRIEKKIIEQIKQSDAFGSLLNYHFHQVYFMKNPEWAEVMIPSTSLPKVVGTAAPVGPFGP